MLAKVPELLARAEMEMSRTLIEAALGIRPAHLSYPVGDKTSAAARGFRIAGELGFKTAVTTRPGVLFHYTATTWWRCRAFHLMVIIRHCVTCGCCCRAPPPRCGTASAA